MVHLHVRGADAAGGSAGATCQEVQSCAARGLPWHLKMPGAAGGTIGLAQPLWARTRPCTTWDCRDEAGWDAALVSMLTLAAASNSPPGWSQLLGCQVLDRYPGVRPPPAELLDALPALAPRLYSIANAPVKVVCPAAMCSSLIAWLAAMHGVVVRGTCWRGVRMLQALMYLAGC